MDADRIAGLHIPVTQLNTDPGFGGECHLDANMVRSALPALPLDEIDLLVIENVGNLVCPAEFRVGEDARAMVCSVTEGEDKPLKYPLMFRTCELVLVNKIDLLPHLRLRPRSLPRKPRLGPSRRRADARQRPDRRGRGGLARLARPAFRGDPSRPRSAGAPGRMTRIAANHGPWRVRRSRCCAGAARGQPALLRGRGRRLARCCHRMAERFARGGRLIAVGRSPVARSDARHVAVEFVHPVIVGKRALPAIGPDRRGRAAARRRSS